MPGPKPALPSGQKPPDPCQGESGAGIEAEVFPMRGRLAAVRGLTKVQKAVALEKDGGFHFMGEFADNCEEFSSTCASGLEPSKATEHKAFALVLPGWRKTDW